MRTGGPGPVTDSWITTGIERLGITFAFKINQHCLGEG